MAAVQKALQAFEAMTDSIHQIKVNYTSLITIFHAQTVNRLEYSTLSPIILDS